MQTDTIKVLFTYVIATILIVGGLIFLYLTTNDTLIPLVAGFVGAAIQFVFNRETQTQTARQVERSQAQGAAAASGGPVV